MIHRAQKLFLNVIAGLFLLLLPTAIFAVSLTQYRDEVHQANQLLLSLTSPEESLTQSENIANQKEIIKQVLAKLPPTEKVELPGGSLDFSNQSLVEKIKQIDSEPFASPRRHQLIVEVYENLSALENKLQELEKQRASDRTKDEEKQKLAEILKRAEYQKPEAVKEGFLQKLWREFWEWVRDVFPQPSLGSPSAGAFESFSSILQIIVLTIVAGLFGFLIYRFAPFLARRFNLIEKKDRKSRVILGEVLAEDETSENLFSEAERLAREGNLRAAVRKGYIALLCELSDRKLIGLARHKTNRDYLRDMRAHKKLFQNMDTMTGSFERYWYGFGAPEEKDWEEFREKYKQTISDKL